MFDASKLTEVLYEQVSKNSYISSNFWRAAKASAPAWLTNGMMPLTKYMKTHPIDFGKTYKGKRILGDHKTWEGFVIGYTSGAAGGFLVDSMMDYTANLFGYILPATNPTYLLAVPLTVQAMDMVESRWKRSRDVAPGELKSRKEKIIDRLSWAAVYPGLYCLLHSISDPMDIALVYGISIASGSVFHYITNKAAERAKWGKHAS